MSAQDVSSVRPACVDITAVLVTEMLSVRSSRRPDLLTDRIALTTVVQQFAKHPDSILDTLVTVALATCSAHSAGISLLRDNDRGEPVFYWPAIAGVWSRYVGGTTPRNFSPCGVVLDRNAPQLFARPERYYDYLLPVDPPLFEALLVPFHVNGTAVGTLWVVSHDDARQFDAEDARRLQTVSWCASGAYQILTALDKATATRAVCAGIRQVLARLDGSVTAPAADPSPLSPRELAVATLVAQGHTNKAVAQRLEVSVKTVETYRARACDKLGFRNRADFVAYALQHGWLHGVHESDGAV